MKEIKFLLKYFKNSKLNVALSFICAFIFVPANLFALFFSGKAVDTFSLYLDNSITQIEFLHSLNLYIVLMSVCILLTVIFQYIFESFVNIFIEKIVTNIRNDIYIKLNKVSIKLIDTHLHGDILSRCVNDIDNISTGLISGYKQLYQGFITVLFTIIFMFVQNWLLGIVVLLLTPSSVFIAYLVTKYGNKYFKRQAKKVGDLSSITLEEFNNLDIIKSFNYEDESFNKFKNANDELYKDGQKAQFVSSFVNPTTRLITNSTYAIVGMVGALLVVFGNNLYVGIDLTVGGVLTFLQYTNQFSKPINEVSGCVTEIQTGLTSLKRVKEVFEYLDDMDEGKEELDKEFKYLEFKDVKFGYDENKIIFNDLSFKINKGMKVALVGPTGCGKTTIINLILRFYDPLSGSIYMNEHNILDVPKKELRDFFTMVLQDTWIFNGTVLENITYSKPEATMDEVITATKKAKYYDFIKRLPKGFDTFINDDIGLSVGEKQLICLARVMLKDSKFLILDEATSNVDTRTEALIGKAMDELMKNKTSLVIAHRLSTIKSSDLILVINNGKIVEKGTHDELLKLNGFYNKLYFSQYQ